MKNLFQICLSLIGLVIAAQIAITLPISAQGIPFTAQSLAVFVIAALLKPRAFLMVISLYLSLGVLGLPVFAEGTSGWSKVGGASGGFLYGFVFAGALISYGCNKLEKLSFSSLIGVMLVGTIVLFVFGLGHLAFKFGWSKALEYGLYPFWQMAIVKALLAGIIVFGVNRAVLTKNNAKFPSH